MSRASTGQAGLSPPRAYRGPMARKTTGARPRKNPAKTVPARARINWVAVLGVVGWGSILLLALWSLGASLILGVGGLALWTPRDTALLTRQRNTANKRKDRTGWVRQEWTRTGLPAYRAGTGNTLDIAHLRNTYYKRLPSTLAEWPIYLRNLRRCVVREIENLCTHKPGHRKTQPCDARETHRPHLAAPDPRSWAAQALRWLGSLMRPEVWDSNETGTVHAYNPLEIVAHVAKVQSRAPWLHVPRPERAAAGGATITPASLSAGERALMKRMGLIRAARLTDPEPTEAEVEALAAPKPKGLPRDPSAPSCDTCAPIWEPGMTERGVWVGRHDRTCPTAIRRGWRGDPQNPPV